MAQDKRTAPAQWIKIDALRGKLSSQWSCFLAGGRYLVEIARISEACGCSMPFPQILWMQMNALAFQQNNDKQRVSASSWRPNVQLRCPTKNLFHDKLFLQLSSATLKHAAKHAMFRECLSCHVLLFRRPLLARTSLAKSVVTMLQHYPGN